MGVILGVYRGYAGIVEKKMETTIEGLRTKVPKGVAPGMNSLEHLYPSVTLMYVCRRSCLHGR